MSKGMERENLNKREKACKMLKVRRALSLRLTAFDPDRKIRRWRKSMINLILAVFCSAAISVLMRMTESRRKSSAAMLCSAILLLARREKPGKWDILFGVLLGVPNYYSSRFLLAALEEVPAVAAYPVYSVGAILLVSLFGVLVFRERLTRQKWIGMGLAAAAVAFLQ